MNIKRVNRAKTYYTMPIYSYNYDNSNEISLYLVVVNNF